MKSTPLRNQTAIAAAAALALVVGGAARARAQDDDDGDLDKIPATETHHVVRPQAEQPAEEAPPARPAPRSEPVAPPEPKATPEARPHSSSAPLDDEEAPAPSRHAKADKRHKKKPTKVSRRHGKARHEGEAADEESGREAPARAAAPSSEPRVIHASPAAAGEDDEAPATVERSAPAPEPGEGEARRPAADSSGGDMDFNLLPQKAGESAEAAAVERKVHTRRTMLQVHQGFGIATAALMAATVVSGQMNYSDRFGGGGGSGQYEIWHDSFEAATVVSFTTAGFLAVLAPTPFEHKSDGIDTVTIHKYSMLVATIGMAAEVPLGIWTVTREGYVNQGTLALTHLVIGYVTAAALTAGASALFF